MQKLLVSFLGMIILGSIILLNISPLSAGSLMDEVISPESSGTTESGVITSVNTASSMYTSHTDTSSSHDAIPLPSSSGSTDEATINTTDVQSNISVLRATPLGTTDSLISTTTPSGVCPGSDATNTCYGVGALWSNTSGGSNTANGYQTLYRNTTGYGNVANGMVALYSNTTGYSNVANGIYALVANTTGYGNVANGMYALSSITTGSNNIGIGNGATVPSNTGSNQLSIGNLIYGNGLTGNGQGNIGIGIANPTVKLDVNGDMRITGRLQITGGTPGVGKVLMSDASGLASWEYISMPTPRTPPRDICPGYGINNTCIGNATLASNSSGAGNVAIGYNALSTNTIGNNNIGIGNQANVPSSTKNNQLSIGNWIYGNNGNISIGTLPGNEKLLVSGEMRVTGNIVTKSLSYSSDRSLKTDIVALDHALENILSLNGYAFTWKDSGKKDIGVIAQEVEKVYPDLVRTDATTGLKSVEYGNLIAPMIEAMKSQQKLIDAQNTRIKSLESEVAKIKSLETRIQRLEGGVRR